MKDLYCSYYTNSSDITEYMVNRLGIQENDIILEPSVGEGVFVDKILEKCSNVEIVALDINHHIIPNLKDKYKKVNNIHIRCTDTLLDEELDLVALNEGYYDKVIGNPPYGAWQDYEKRLKLKKKYDGQYVKETYTLFLLRSISLLKYGGRLSFIIPDTFLFLNMHEKLRHLLLTQTKIEEILVFPSKFFPKVSFGYSNLSIITLTKCHNYEALDHKIRVVKGFKSTEELNPLLEEIYPESIQIHYLQQKDVLNNEKSRFILAEEQLKNLLKSETKRLGDVADIVTGFYSGDNKRFVRAKDTNVKGAKNYQIVDESKVYDSNSLEGISFVEDGYIPYVKSSSGYRYKRNEDEWYIKWDASTVDFYVKNKKSRFQNSKFYFRTGIAIPMVKSREIKATIMENRVFDQSIVGIFPKEEQKMYYILALMNSDIINKLIHTINPTANNSSNYIKQVPYKEPDISDLRVIDDLVKQIMLLDPYKNQKQVEELHFLINEKINEVYS